jgi:hypothetical protein
MMRHQPISSDITTIIGELEAATCLGMRSALAAIYFSFWLTESFKPLTVPLQALPWTPYNTLVLIPLPRVGQDSTNFHQNVFYPANPGL